jgi:hypothetical protein
MTPSAIVITRVSAAVAMMMTSSMVAMVMTPSMVATVVSTSTMMAWCSANCSCCYGCYKKNYQQNGYYLFHSPRRLFQHSIHSFVYIKAFIFDFQFNYSNLEFISNYY